MKKILLSTALICASFAMKAQTKFSIGTFYSSPLHTFCIDDYQDGAGLQFGIGKQFNIDSVWAIEGAFNWQWGVNGSEDVDLVMGNYDLSNRFFNWQFKLNVVKDMGVFSPYAGIHLGEGKYYTAEYLNFDETQEDGESYYSDKLFGNYTFQFGGQIGTYISMSDNFDFNLGVSVNKGDTKVKYIDYDTYSFDGSEIDYQEKSSKPFMILLNAGFVLKFNKSDIQNMDYSSSSIFDSNNYYDSNSYSDSEESETYCPSRSTNYYNNSSSSNSSSSNESSSSSNHSKAKEKSSLIKNGKTPVGYK